MTIFQLDEQYAIVAEWKKTRVAFKHTATLLRNGSQVGETKICYQNRTWECYEYESVIEKLLDQHFTGEQKTKYLAVCKAKALGEVDAKFGVVRGLVALGELLGSTPAEKNALKKRALSTVPGIEFPDDFDALPAEEQARRLNGAAKVLTTKEG